MTAPENPAAKDPRWRLALAAAAVLAGVLIYRVLALPLEESTPQQAAPVMDQQVIQLVIRQPDKPVQEIEIPWSEGQTVADATRLAADTEWRGSGEMLLLESLGGVASQGPAGLNWQFEVNGAYATRSAAAVRLSPGDRVLWKLAPYE